MSSAEKSGKIGVSINILIVDDELSMDKLIRKIFRREQREDFYSFKYLNSADAAYAYLLEKNDIDIILLDINMPGELEGLALLKKIKEINPLIKTIMISAFGDMDQSRIALQDGAFDFIQKPLDQEDLKFSVKRAADYINEAKKVTKLLLEVDVLNYMVKNDVIDYIKSESLEKRNHESRKEKACILAASVKHSDGFFIQENFEAVIRDLNRFFTIITKHIHNYDGYVDSFIGTLCFGILIGSNSPINVFRAALDILSECNKMINLESGGDISDTGITMGIDYGDILIGNLGSVDPIRLERTVTGPPIMKALTLATSGEKNQILFSKKSSFDFVLHKFECQEMEDQPGVFLVIDEKNF